jgi:hypothetical protein
MSLETWHTLEHQSTASLTGTEERQIHAEHTDLLFTYFT